MKLPLLCCCLALVAVTPSAMACGHAQSAKDPLSQLGLTSTQKAQIAQIRHSAAAPKVKHAEILAVLTPDQKAELKQLAAHRKG
jgi:Spy/CpxP family protein refolding chaperone